MGNGYEAILGFPKKQRANRQNGRVTSATCSHQKNRINSWSSVIHFRVCSCRQRILTREDCGSHKKAWCGSRDLNPG
jgi:hypothetical protein